MKNNSSKSLIGRSFVPKGAGPGLSCLVLAGGESKRFKENKALYNLEGRTFLGRALGVAAELSDDIAVSIRNISQKQEYEKITKKVLCRNNEIIPAKFIEDNNSCGFSGPLKGIYSSIAGLKGKYIFIMQCDAPFFEAAAAREIIRKALTEKAKAVVPIWDDSTPEPLLGCYERKYILYILDILNKYALGMGNNFLFNDVVNILRFAPSVYYYSISELMRKDSEISCEMFLNVNSKGDELLSDKLKAKGRAMSKSVDGKSVKVLRRNRFFDIKEPAGEPFGLAAKALYFWWVYSVTGNFAYFKKSVNLFRSDSMLYFKKGLFFMGDKLIRVLPNVEQLLKI